MLEDESGRINLVGEQIRSAGLVTGVILGALGMEISSGDFEVVDFCFAGMPPQPRISLPDIESMDVDCEYAAPLPMLTHVQTIYLASPSDSDEWVALVSGLEVGAPRPCDAQIQMLVEFLTGELGDSEDQLTSSRISRLIIAGNSIAEVVTTNIAVEDQDQKTVSSA